MTQFIAMLFGLIPTRTQQFQRSVFKTTVQTKGGKKTKVKKLLKTLVFVPGEKTVVSSEEECLAIADDVGVAIGLLEEDQETGKLRYNSVETQQLIVDIAKEKVAAGLRLTKIQRRLYEQQLILDQQEEAEDEAELEEEEGSELDAAEQKRLKEEAEIARKEAEAEQKLLEEEAEQKRLELESLNESMLELQKRIDSLTPQISELEAKIVETEDEEALKSLNEQLESVNADVSNLQQEYTGLEVKQVESEVDAISVLIETIEPGDKREIAKHKGKRTKLEKKLTSLKASLA